MQHESLQLISMFLYWNKSYWSISVASVVPFVGNLLRVYSRFSLADCCTEAKQSKLMLETSFLNLMFINPCIFISSIFIQLSIFVYELDQSNKKLTEVISDEYLLKIYYAVRRITANIYGRKHSIPCNRYAQICCSACL